MSSLNIHFGRNAIWFDLKNSNGDNNGLDELSRATYECSDRDLILSVLFHTQKKIFQ